MLVASKSNGLVFPVNGDDFTAVFGLRLQGKMRGVFDVANFLHF